MIFDPRQRLAHCDEAILQPQPASIDAKHTRRMAGLQPTQHPPVDANARRAQLAFVA